MAFVKTGRVAHHYGNKNNKMCLTIYIEDVKLFLKLRP